MRAGFYILSLLFLIVAGPKSVLAQENKTSGIKHLDLGMVPLKPGINPVYDQNFRTSLSHPFPGSAPKKRFQWTKTDTVLQVSYTALHVFDWAQTLNIANHPDRWHEKNSVLGRHPSASKVNIYFGTILAGYTIVNVLLPKKWRRASQIAGIGIEGYTVEENFRGGYYPKF